jgi:hypothetical protein
MNPGNVVARAKRGQALSEHPRIALNGGHTFRIDEATVPGLLLVTKLARHALPLIDAKPSLYKRPALGNNVAVVVSVMT